MSDELTRVRQELEETRVLLRRAEHLRSLLSSLHSEQRREESKLQKLRLRLDQERSDVERLERLSFTALLWMLSGQKASRQEKEIAELAAAKLKHDAALAAAQNREAERNRLTSELATLHHVEAKYAALIADKERLLLETGDAKGQQAATLADRLAELRPQLRELDEAVSAGENASQAVRRLSEALKEALRWGKWDMVSGDWITTSVKHRHLDTANEHAQAARDQVARFERELADTEIRLHGFSEPGLTGADRFMDLFLDNFFLDYQLQRKIEQSHASVELLERQLATALVEVTGRRGQVRSELKAVEEERVRLLEQA